MFSSYSSVSTARVFFLHSVSFQFEMNKNSFWFIIWSHNFNSRVNSERSALEKKEELFVYEQTAFSLFHCPQLFMMKGTRSIYSQVAPNKKTSHHITSHKSAQTCWKKYYNELVLFFSTSTLPLVELNWWISDSINFVFVLTSLDIFHSLDSRIRWSFSGLKLRSFWIQ